MTKKDTLKAPRHLRPATADWWSEVLAQFELESHHVRLLTLAAESWDRGQAAREEIDRLGMTYLDRFEQPSVRPEVGIERDSRIAFARLLRELALDVDAPAEEARAPGIHGNARLKMRG